MISGSPAFKGVQLFGYPTAHFHLVQCDCLGLRRRVLNKCQFCLALISPHGSRFSSLHKTSSCVDDTSILVTVVLEYASRNGQALENILLTNDDSLGQYNWNYLRGVGLAWQRVLGQLLSAVLGHCVWGHCHGDAHIRSMATTAEDCTFVAASAAHEGFEV